MAPPLDGVHVRNLPQVPPLSSSINILSDLANVGQFNGISTSIKGQPSERENMFAPRNISVSIPPPKFTAPCREISRFSIQSVTAHPQPGLVESSIKSRIYDYMQSGTASPKPTEGLGLRTPHLGSNIDSFGSNSAEIHEPISAKIYSNFSAGVQDPTPIQVAENSENSANISPPSPAGSSEGSEGFWEYPPGFEKSILDSPPLDSKSLYL